MAGGADVIDLTLSSDEDTPRPPARKRARVAAAGGDSDFELIDAPPPRPQQGPMSGAGGAAGGDGDAAGGDVDGDVQLTGVTGVVRPCPCAGTARGARAWEPRAALAALRLTPAAPRRRFRLPTFCTRGTRAPTCRLPPRRAPRSAKSAAATSVTCLRATARAGERARSRWTMPTQRPARTGASCGQPCGLLRPQQLGAGAVAVAVAGAAGLHPAAGAGAAVAVGPRAPSRRTRTPTTCLPRCGLWSWETLRGGGQAHGACLRHRRRLRALALTART
jgi:hypothetical protein